MYFFGKEISLTEKTGPNRPTRLLSCCRIPGPAPDQTLWLSTRSAPDDDSMEPRLLDTSMDEWQGLVLRDKGPDRCAGRWIYPWNNSLRDVLL